MNENFDDCYIDEDLDDINSIEAASPDFRTELAKQLAEIAPEAIADGKVDFEKLKELLGDDVSTTPERFGLFWPGKREAIRIAQTPTTATLKPDFENSVDWDTTENVFIEGDNLEVLKILQRHYYGKIKMIYIDPPYNTGQDFIYEDDFKDGVENYLKWSRQLTEEGQVATSNSDKDGRFHSNWLNMMYPRLKLARNLLSKDGLIAISIDDKEFSHLKRMMDEIFGELNFRNTLIVRRRVKSLNSQFAKCGLASLNVGTENILVYARSSEATLQPLHVMKEKTSNKGRWDVFWSNTDRPTMRYELLGFTPTEGQWRNKKERALKAVANYDEYLENYEQHETLEEYSQRTGITKFIRRIPDGKGKNGGVQHWIAPSDTMLRTSLWTDLEVSQIKKEIELPFDNPKSRLLIQELIKLFGVGDGEIILDFFAGSATTAHSTMHLNAEDSGKRSFIMVQLPQLIGQRTKKSSNFGFSTISDLSCERIRQAAIKIKKDFFDELERRPLSFDPGFRAYKLVDTNFTKWRVPSDIDENQLEQRVLNFQDSANDGASIDDLLTELLLKQGFSLTEKISDVEISALPLKAIHESSGGGVALLAYLDQHRAPTIEQLREVIATKPTSFIILEDCFGGSDELKTNLAQMCKTNNVELWTA